MKWFCVSLLFAECLAFSALHAKHSLCHRFERKCRISSHFDVQKCECPETEWKKFKRNCGGRNFERKRLGCASRERKKAGQFCVSSAQCVDDGQAQYLCIANLCQIPPECPPGHVSVGVECFPFAAGGECIHPVQCLAGSVCIRGRCRGPCAEDQVFVEDSCVHYEGAGCVARACVEHKCPRAFPSCNYVPQRGEYLCCERQIRAAAQCPDPVAIPQLSPLTNEVVNCMAEQCGPGFTCQFSNGGGGSYICCSVPDKRRQKNKKEISNRNLLHSKQ